MSAVELTAGTAGAEAEVATQVADRPPLVRSAVYAFRALIGLAMLVVGVVLLLVFENALLGARADIASLQEGWPGWVGMATAVALGLIWWTAVLGINAYLLYRRLFRRWIMINAAVLAAILLGVLVSNTVLTVATSDALRAALEAAVAEGSSDTGIGNNGLATLIAALTVGSVWIGPRLRPWAIAFVAIVASFSFLPGFGSVYMVALPVDVGIGVLAGALTALILKTRDRTPTHDELAAALEHDGIPVRHVERASVDARGSVPWFVTTTADEKLFVKTLTSDHRAADLMFRIYRMIRLRRAGDRRPFSSLRQSVEHEAFLSLAAEARAIRTPQLVTVAEVGTDGMLLAYRRIEGRSLDTFEPAAVTDRMLVDLWRLVALLRGAAIAHRDLRLANVFVADDGVPWLIDFGFAELAADETLLARDNAELIASTAAVVGPERSVGAAMEVLGGVGVAEALPWIQPLALSSATRSQIGRSEAYEALRAVAARAVGVDDVDYERIERVKPGTLVILASIAIALYLLIPQVASATGLFDELATAQWGWVAVAVVASALTYVGAGLGMVGAVPVRLRFGAVTMAQLASSFSNRVTPVKVGGMATNVRFLQKQNLTMPMAVTAVGLNTVAGTLVHISLLVLFGAIAWRSVDVPLPDTESVAIIVGVLVLLSGLFMVLPVGRKLLTSYLLPALRAGLSSVAVIARTPAKVLALFAGSAVTTLGYTAAMVASLAAFGADIPVAAVAAVYLAGSAVASVAPTPGGLGATEAALVAGYTAVGVEAATALAAVLLFRLVTFWLPILPGWLALVGLQRSGRL